MADELECSSQNHLFLVIQERFFELWKVCTPLYYSVYTTIFISMSGNAKFTPWAEVWFQIILEPYPITNWTHRAKWIFEKVFVKFSMSTFIMNESSSAYGGMTFTKQKLIVQLNQLNYCQYSINSHFVAYDQPPTTVACNTFFRALYYQLIYTQLFTIFIGFCAFFYSLRIWITHS